jgi:hypothetical protein
MIPPERGLLKALDPAIARSAYKGAVLAIYFGRVAGEVG